MSPMLRQIRTTVRERRAIWIAVLMCFLALYYGGLLTAMVIRFDNIPNYVTWYNYPANVYEILVSTPALSDAWPIVREEWLIEIGYMNYDFGHGISEWAMTVLPPKLLTMTIVAMLAATAIVLTLPTKFGTCPSSTSRRAVAATGGGTALVGLSSATLSWVVCCATPTWVVSLAMLGMSASTALWLEPLGDVITYSGFALLLLAVFWLARRRFAQQADALPNNRISPPDNWNMRFSGLKRGHDV